MNYDAIWRVLSDLITEFNKIVNARHTRVPSQMLSRRHGSDSAAHAVRNQSHIQHLTRTPLRSVRAAKKREIEDNDGHYLRDLIILSSTIGVATSVNIDQASGTRSTNGWLKPCP